MLIDSGTGGGQAGGPKAGILAQSMAAAGIDPKAVKTIVISHFHGDHIFGLMAKDTNAQMFPRRGDHRAGGGVEVVDAAGRCDPEAAPRPRPARTGDVADLEERQAGRRRSRRGAGHPRDSRRTAIPRATPPISSAPAASNCSSRPTPPTSQALFVKNPEWQAAFDHVPDQAVETRKKLFDRAIADKAMVAGYHWGLPNVGTIAKDGNGYAFTPAA